MKRKIDVQKNLWNNGTGAGYISQYINHKKSGWRYLQLY